VEAGVGKNLELALAGIDNTPRRPARLRAHKLLAFGSGAIGGFFGPVALLVELPFATHLMLRAIADIARQEGEDLSSLDTRLACLQVFALGGRTREDDAAETGYYGLRITLALHFETLSGYPGVQEIPGAVELIRGIAARFGVVITDKAAAQMVPVLGATSASLLNLAFLSHYQNVARGHFIVRRLERQYGSAKVRAAFEKLRKKDNKTQRDFSPVEGW
ncbi:MAG: EcsC family protein, partial [Candidatus Competibacteraceae bacterium]|nr:EcsC family protein [Candidatus Competibacteraceae bacterium]